MCWAGALSLMNTPVNTWVPIISGLCRAMCECSVHIPLSAIKIFPLPGVLSGPQAAELIPRCPALACLSLLSQQCCQGFNNLLQSQVDNILPDISVCVLLCISAFLRRHLASLSWDFDLVVNLGNFILWRISDLTPWHMLLSYYRVCSNFPFFFIFLSIAFYPEKSVFFFYPPPLFKGVGWPFFARTSGLECLIPLPPLCQDCRNVSPHLALLTFFAEGIQSGKENLCLLSLQVSGTPPALITQCLDNWYLSHSPTSLSGLPCVLQLRSFSMPLTLLLFATFVICCLLSPK